MKKMMMMAAMLTVSLAAMAQHEAGDFMVQPKVGMNISTLSDANKSIVDFSFGLEAEYMITDFLSLSAGAIASNQGGKYDDQYGKYTADLDYVNVPVMANFYVLPGLALKVGVQPAFRMKAKVKTDNGTLDFDEFYAMARGQGRSSDDLKVNKFDLSIPVGVSYEFYNVTLDARYNWGLTKIMNEGDAFYNRVFQLTLGYKFTFEL